VAWPARRGHRSCKGDAGAQAAPPGFGRAEAPVVAHHSARPPEARRGRGGLHGGGKRRSAWRIEDGEGGAAVSWHRRRSGPSQPLWRRACMCVWRGGAQERGLGGCGARGEG
jgi:hypothetical protein